MKKGIIWDKQKGHGIERLTVCGILYIKQWPINELAFLLPQLFC